MELQTLGPGRLEHAAQSAAPFTAPLGQPQIWMQLTATQSSLPRVPNTLRSEAKRRHRNDDVMLAITSLLAAMLAMPMARLHAAPEAAALLAVAAVALLAHQRWAIAIIVLAELALLRAILPEAVTLEASTQHTLAALSALACLPGLLFIRRAAAALLLVLPVRRTQQRVRQTRLGLAMVSLLVFIAPLWP